MCEGGSMRNFAFIFCILVLIPGMGHAQAAAPGEAKGDQEDRLKALEAEVRVLEAEVKALKADRGPRLVQTAATLGPEAGAGVLASPLPASNPVAESPSAAQGPDAAGQSQLPVYGGASSMAKVLNPDVSVI